MINTNDFIQYKNVIQKSYDFHYMEMDAVMHNFTSVLNDLDVTIVGPMMYALKNLPSDKMMSCDFLMPVAEDYVNVPEDVIFHSYYEVYDMLSIAVNEPLETNTELGLAELLVNIKENSLEQATPVYHVFPRDDSLKYVILKVGVIRGE